VIKATGTYADGSPVLLLGLSYRNLKALQGDEPIVFDGTPYGYPGKIVIFAGPTEASMARKIERDNPGIVKHIEPDAP
jgi:hypothetical protein